MCGHFLNLVILTLFQLHAFSDVLTIKNNSSIQQAINNAESGQTIIIEQGRYTEKLTISKSIILKAAEGQSVILACSTCQEPLLNITDCNNVTISGLNFDGMSQEPGCENIKNGRSIVNIEKSSVNIIDCKIENSFGSGVLILSQSSCNIINTDCLNNLVSGIWAYGENIKLEVQNSRCNQNHVNGIYLSKGAVGELKNNTCFNNVYNGISVSECPKEVYLADNNCDNNTTGLYIGEGSKCRAIANHSNNNSRQGILVSGDGTDVVLEKNTCTQNGYNGIYLEKNCIAMLKDNICVRNIWHGISVNDGIKEVRLFANQCSENQREGVWQYDSNTFVADDNIFKDNGDISFWYILHLFKTQKFDKLESIVQDLRETKKRYKNGDWQLKGFYDAITKANVFSGSNSTLLESTDEQWVKARPDSVTPRIVLAKFYSDLAWNERGNKWAYQVTEEGWKGMEKYNALSVEQVKKAIALKVDEPELYDLYQSLALSVSEFRENSEEVFQKAIKVYPDYWPLYTERAYFLLPRWHGNPGDVGRFAEQCASTLGEPNGLIVYGMIAENSLCPSYDKLPDQVIDLGFSYKKVKAGLEQLIKTWQEPLKYKQTLCAYACIYQDKETAKKLFNELSESGFYWQDQMYSYNLKRWAQSGAEYPQYQRKNEDD